MRSVAGHAQELPDFLSQDLVLARVEAPGHGRRSGFSIAGQRVHGAPKHRSLARACQKHHVGEYPPEDCGNAVDGPPVADNMPAPFELKPSAIRKKD
jgi:hypothetical protein